MNKRGWALVLWALVCLAGTPCCLAAGAGPGDLELSGFQVAAPSPAPLGTRATVEFTLRNVSRRSLTFDSYLVVFLAVKVTSPGDNAPLRRNFGKRHQNGVLAPGQTLSFRDTLPLDRPGTWLLTPACEFDGELVVFDQQARTLAVGAGAATPVAAPAKAAAAPAARVSGAIATPAPAAAPAGERQGLLRLKVLSYNINSLTASSAPAGWEEVLRILAAERPDLLVVQEAVPTDISRLAQAAGLPHYTAIKAYGPGEVGPRVGMFSRWPMKVRSVPMHVSEAGRERSFGLAEVDMEGVPLSFYGLHFSRAGLVDKRLVGLVKEFLGQGRREEEAQTVVQELRQDGHRLKLLAGDLNTYPQSGPYRLLTGQLQDAFAETAPGTYRMDMLNTRDKAKVDRATLERLPNPKIDHIMHSQALQTLEARVITRGQSDHYPVTAVLQVQLADQTLSPRKIEAAQQGLIRLGLLASPASGRLDPATRRAFVAFQASKGLPIDGMLSGQTLRQLAP